MAAYALADIVTMGGSFSNIGGHNPLEPALFKKPIIVGNDMKNFTEILLQLQKNNGIIQVPVIENENQQALAQAVIHLLNNTQAAQLLGSQAYKVVLNNQGASTRTLAQVKELVI
jgi:3-deoxy-D-manno-octulosonic-acid transferase